MAPRWGRGRKLIGTDAKTSAEIADHPQNHPSPRLRILPPDGFTSGTEHSSPPGFVPPCPSRGRCVLSRRLRAFRSRAGPHGASPPARLLPVTHTRCLARRPPALTDGAAPHPCGASRLFGCAAGNRRCLLSKAACSSVGAAPRVCALPERLPWSAGGAGSGARCRRCLHSDPRVVPGVAVHPSGMTPLRDRSLGSPGGGPAADITQSHPSVSGSFPVYICFSVAGGAPPSNTK